MDWGRYLRANAAAKAEAVEQERSLFFARQKTAEELGDDVWQAIEEHDAVLAEIASDDA